MLDRVFAHIESHEPEYRENLKTLLRQPSISAQKVGLNEMAILVKQTMEKHGVSARIIAVPEGPPVVYGERKGRSDKTLLFYNHYDVQPPEPLELWQSPPFEPTERDGKLFARGVADNKANLYARLAAIKSFLEVAGELPVSVKFCVEGEEEVGSTHLAAFVEQHQELLKADACIWETGGVNWEGQPNITLGLKGILYVELEVHGPARDVHSAMGTSVPNPAWRLVWALSTLKDQNERIQIEGFYDHVKPPSPADLAAAARIPDDTEKTRVNLGLDKFLLGLTGVELRKRNLFEPTCTICGIWGGYTGPGGKTVLPAVARAKLDFRLVPDQDPEDILAKLRQHLKRHGFSDVKVKDLENGERPARTPLDHPFVAVVADTARLVYGQEPVIVPTMGGSGPMYPFTNVLKLPVASAGCGYPDSRGHAPNENIRLADFVLGMKHVAAILDRMAG